MKKSKRMVMLQSLNSLSSNGRMLACRSDGGSIPSNESISWRRNSEAEWLAFNQHVGMAEFPASTISCWRNSIGRVLGPYPKRCGFKSRRQYHFMPG